MPPGCRPASLPDLARRRQAQRDQQQPQVKVRQCPAVWSKLMAASAPRMPSCGCPAAAARWRRSSRVYQAADLRQQRRRSWWRRPRQGIEAGAAEEQREAGGGGQDKESKLALLRSSGGEVGGGGQDKESKLALLRSSSG
ncbi:hypothetical protein PF011_g26646 [Phytophthora fragariae]|nr:hypothetical protein PF009_g20736 [Phytophthora fragariae]KAE8969842.1 hypothetical protein PF011_g26646 [Phytophthora fragariae]